MTPMAQNLYIAIAVRQFMENHTDSYEMLHVRFARQPSLVLKKIK